MDVNDKFVELKNYLEIKFKQIGEKFAENDDMFTSLELLYKNLNKSMETYNSLLRLQISDFAAMRGIIYELNEITRSEMNPSLLGLKEEMREANKILGRLVEDVSFQSLEIDRLKEKVI